MGFEEEFESYKSAQSQSREFNVEQDFAAYKKDMAQGGSIRQAPREAPFSVGGLVGGVGAGIASGGNPAAAIIGAAGGEAVQQLVERAVGADSAPITTGEAAQRITQEGVAMGVGEGIGRGLVFLMDKLGKPLVGHMRPEMVAAEHFLAGKTDKPVFLPAESTDTRILDVMENVAEYSLLGGGAIKKFKQDRDVFFGQLADEIVGRYGKPMTDIEIGRSVIDATKRNLEMARMPAKLIYNSIERATAPTYVDVPMQMKVTRVEGKPRGASAPEQTKSSGKKSLSEKDVYGDSLAEFLASQGGIKDQGGEISRLEMKTKPFKKKLIKDTGMDLDTAAEMAAEAGYLPERDVNALINALDSEARGKPLYSPANVKPGHEDALFEQAFETKVSFQNIQVGDRLERLKVMTRMEERQISGAKINLVPMQEELAEISKIAKQAGGLADKEMGTTLLQFIQAKPAFVSYPVAKAIRTEVRTMADTLKSAIETKNAPAIGKANTIYGKLTDAIRTGLKEDDPFLADMWDEANRIESGAQQTFNNKLIRSLVKEADARGGDSPGAIASSVWDASKDNVTPIKRIRAAVDFSDWKKMQRWEIQDAISRSLDNGVVSGKKLEQHWFGPTGVGHEAMTEGFDAATVKEMKEFISVLKIAQERQTEGVGRVLIQLQQGSGGLLLAAEGLSQLGIIDAEFPVSAVAGASAVVLAPWMLSHVMTHPQGIRWLTQGFSTPNKGKESVALASRILSAALPRPSIQDAAPAQPMRPTTRIAPMGVQQ